MKKRILIASIITAVSAINAHATILFVSSCGEVTYTVDQSYFDSAEEAEAYYKQLDEILCKDKNKDNNKQEFNGKIEKEDENRDPLP